MAKILVVSVHPDDETLGAGGTLLRHKHEGDEIHWLLVTGLDGVPWASDELRAKKNAQIEEVKKLYAFDSLTKLNWPATKLDEIPFADQMTKFEEVFHKIQPEIVYIPFWGDVHTDHRRVYDLSFSCVKPFRHPYVKQVYAMEVPSETDQALPTGSNYFMPNTFVDISSFLTKKLSILKLYTTEVGKHPFPRSETNIQAWSIVRGAQANMEHAEAFVCIKNLR